MKDTTYCDYKYKQNYETERSMSTNLVLSSEHSVTVALVSVMTLRWVD